MLQQISEWSTILLRTKLRLILETWRYILWRVMIRKTKILQYGLKRPHGNIACIRAARNYWRNPNVWYMGDHRIVHMVYKQSLNATRTGSLIRYVQQFIYQNRYSYKCLTTVLNRTHTCIIKYFNFENDKKSRSKAAFWALRNYHQIYFQSFLLSPKTTKVNSVRTLW